MPNRRVDALFGITPTDKSWKDAVKVASSYWGTDIFNKDKVSISDPSDSFLKGLKAAGLKVYKEKLNIEAIKAIWAKSGKPENYDEPWIYDYEGCSVYISSKPDALWADCTVKHRDIANVSTNKFRLKKSIASYDLDGNVLSEKAEDFLKKLYIAYPDSKFAKQNIIGEIDVGIFTNSELIKIKCFAMKVYDLLEQHSMEIVQSISGNFQDFDDDAVMFRIDTTDPQDIVQNKGFRHLPARSSKSAGIGGIYFWSHLDAAIKYAAEDGSDFFFMVARPTSQPEVFQFSTDFLFARRDHLVVSDTYLRGVDTYILRGMPDPRDEYVKAGAVGHIFIPTALAIIQKKAHHAEHVMEEAKGT